MKVDHQRPARLLKPLPIPEWKWDNIAMGFVSGFPRISKGLHTVWVVVDKLSKFAHFLTIKTITSSEKLAELYFDKIMWLYGILVMIVLYRDSKFVAYC